MHNGNGLSDITVSIVSHGHGSMVSELLADLSDFKEISHIIITYNIKEKYIDIPAPLQSKTTVIFNEEPLGFGANHNQAFKYCVTPFFCVLNPDVRLSKNPFPSLRKVLDSSGAAICAPRIVDPAGRQEDSARYFPTPLSLLLKLLRMSDGRYPLGQSGGYVFPDWIAGMFLLLRSCNFSELNGFDESFYLYYEDVDLCARLRRAGYGIALDLEAYAVHNARRSSHRKVRYVMWHLQSLFRYLWKHYGRTPRLDKVKACTF